MAAAAATRPEEPRAPCDEARTTGRGRVHDLAWCAGLVALAVFYRFYRLRTLPPGLYPDEAMNGNDALASLESGRFPVFYPENYGREGLFIWIIALSFRLHGVTVAALRLPSAVIGTLTVVAVYLLARELYGHRVAILAGAFTAVTFWHVNFSRIGLRAILVPLVLCTAFWLFLRALRRPSSALLLSAGALFGLGLYTYTAFRAALVLLLITVVLVPWEHWPRPSLGRLRHSALGRLVPIAGLLATAALVALPLALYSARQPEAFSFRARRVSVAGAEDAAQALWRSAALTAGMFFVRGDATVRHSDRAAPVLPISISPFFALGLAVALASAARPGRPEQTVAEPGGAFDARRSAVFLLSWLVVMALPVVLTARGVPHALRSIGMLPAAFVLSAVGVEAATRALARVAGRAALVLPFAVALLAAAQGYHAYFVSWARLPYLPEAFRQDLVDKALFLKARSPASGAYVVTNDRGLPVPYPDGLPMPTQTLQFLLHEDCRLGQPVTISCPVFVAPDALPSLDVDGSRPNAFLLMRDNPGQAGALEKRFPGGRWLEFRSTQVYLWPR